MKIQIRRIRPEGMELDELFPVDLIGLTQTDALTFVSPFEITAKVTRAEDEVLAAVTVKSRYESFCSRCLEAITQDWAMEFMLTFDVKEYSEFIELDDDIRQELILNMPARILCRAQCKGLCVDCGTNLNAEECKHKHAVTSGT
jgi:uncharacterized protein